MSSNAVSLVNIIVSFIASFIGAWIAARFALYRFYREKVWERKTLAYTTIFEALHDMTLWFDAQIRAEETSREISEEDQKRLSEDYKKAKAGLIRRLASEAWLIPAACQQRIERMTEELDRRNDDWTWYDMVDNGAVAVSSAVNDLRRMTRIDLGLERPSWGNYVRKLTH